MNHNTNHNYKLRPRSRTRSNLLSYFYETEPEPFYEDIDEPELTYANEENPENEDFPME
jgi:hypothetical protein